MLLARTGAALPLRRTAERVEPDVAGPDRTTGWDRLVLPPGAAATAAEVLGYGADVCVEEPASLRDEVVARLTAAAR